jgi:hypothetical protein
VGVSASSSSLSPSSVLSLLDRARGTVSARELRVLVSRSATSPWAASSHRPPPPSPPGTNLRRLFGGSVVGSRPALTRDLAGVRVGRRGDCSVEAIVVAAGATIACAVRCRKWCYKLLQVGKGKASLWCVYLAAQKLCGWRMALCRRSRVGVFVVCDKLRMRYPPRVTLHSFTQIGIAVLFTGREAATLL